MHQLSLIPDTPPTFRVIVGPEDRPREWNVYYSDGRITRFQLDNRPGWVRSVRCDHFGRPVTAVRLAPATLLDAASYPTTYHDSGD